MNRTIPLLVAILPDFEKEFPEIKVTAVTGRGNQLGPRLLAERRTETFLSQQVPAPELRLMRRMGSEVLR